MRSKIEARYRTAGGRVIEVKSHKDFPDDYETYTWLCPGCRTEGRMSRGSLSDYQKAAQDHADTCRAI
ncbi:hypothetical protein [Kitasatospora sp. NPDC056731]|uniref:hypothetical protein n=1 Tax=Kitasatospora sp. NPDC056731 TaxID=3155422 RepID=UPI0034159A52